MFLRAAVFCVMVSPAAAGCVDYKSFTKGVTVKLVDGSVWSVRRGAHDVIRIDQTNAEASYAKYVVGPYGVYPTESTRNGTGTVSEYTYLRPPVEPVAGMDWTSNVKAFVTTLSDKHAEMWREKAHVTAGDPGMLQIGSCSYKVLGVDLGHLGGPYPTVQHFTYFPDLKFGIQTRITYGKDTVKKSAVLTMKAQ